MARKRPATNAQHDRPAAQAWPQYRLPSDCSLPLRAFLNAVKADARDVLEKLQQAVAAETLLGVDQDDVVAASRQYLRGEEVTHREVSEKVIGPVWRWGEECRLLEPLAAFQARRPWASVEGFAFYCYHRTLVLVATDTLRAWAASAEKAAAGEWVIHVPTFVSATPLETTWAEVEFLDVLDATGVLKGRLVVDSPSNVLPFSAQVPGYNPLNESRAAAKARMLKDVASLIDAQQEQAERELKRIAALRVPDKVELNDFKVLTLYQVLGLSQAEVMERMGEVNHQTIQKAVNRAAEFLMGEWYTHWKRPRSKAGAKPGKRRVKRSHFPAGGEQEMGTTRPPEE
jgi:hypothetical protein